MKPVVRVAAEKDKAKAACLKIILLTSTPNRVVPASRFINFNNFSNLDYRVSKIEGKNVMILIFFSFKIKLYPRTRYSRKKNVFVPGALPLFSLIMLIVKVMGER